MKYGSLISAFEAIESCIDLSNLVELGVKPAPPTCKGNLNLWQFRLGMKRCIPNWNEISGFSGSLLKLFRLIDDNDSQYVSFEELMGVKIDDPIASHVFNNCQKRPMEQLKG